MGALHQTTGPQPEEQVDLSQGACKQRWEWRSQAVCVGVSTPREGNREHCTRHCTRAPSEPPQPRCRKSDAANAIAQPSLGV